MTKVDAFRHVLPQPYYDRLQEISADRAANLLRRTAPITWARWVSRCTTT
jgi:hypothetical protein